MIPFNGKCQNLLGTHAHFFALAPTVSEILKVEIFVIEKVGEDHGVQLLH